MRTYLLALALAACGGVDAAPSPPASSLVIANLAPGQFSVENPTASSAHLRTVMTVEEKTASGWKPLNGLDAGDGLRLVEKCGKAPACIDLAPGAALHPVPWTGFLCSSQCNQSCDKNYIRRGTYRVVVANCDGTPNVVGPAFEVHDGMPTFEKAGVTTDIVSATTMRADLPKTGYDPAGKPAPDRVAGLVRRGAERVMTHTELDALLALLRDQAHLDTVTAKRCLSDHHVGFRLAHTVATSTGSRVEDVELSIDFACDRVFAVNGGVVTAAFFARGPWLVLAQSLFPGDAELAGLR